MQHSEIDKVFVIEVCENCRTHNWNTRHDEAKYKQYADEMAAKIKSVVPEASVLVNKVPKAWVDFEIYCQLVPNNDNNEISYQMIPRTGAFEVSFKGVLLFSKLLSGLWPHFDSVGKKCQKMFSDYKAGKDIHVYQTNGTEDKRAGDSLRKTMKNSSLSPQKNNQSLNQTNGTTSNFIQQQPPSNKNQANSSPVQQQQPSPQKNDGGAASGGDILCSNKLKTFNDLTGFPTFPPGTKSLLCKYLTRDIWQKYGNEKDKFGFSFKECIFSGCQNIDSGIGVYAGSHDSYIKFADFFDLIVQDYHGHKKTDKHVSDMDASKLKCPPLPPEDAILIRSTRVRVGRNLEGFPLGPGITNDQRKQIEKTVADAVSKFTGDLAGTYYPLNNLTEQQRKQLIDDHFLFKEGDRFLEAVGLNRDWPNGRGIFHNKEKSFLVWVNEEDQLRIISMQDGADLGAVFDRLSRACGQIEKVAKFDKNDHLGYITSCPTNLGTALRASVHIYLPFLSQKKDDFQKIADQFFVQIRGIHGEHTESNEPVFDISNKRRLGRSEAQLVQDMYDGVKAMITKERELAAAAKAIMSSTLKSPTELVNFPLFPPGTKSLLCKHLSPQIWAKYKDMKDKSGFSFKQAIFSGCQNVDSGVGVYAGSADSYVTFNEFFDKIVNAYHGVGKHVSEANMSADHLQAPPLDPHDAAMIVSTRIRVGRNLKEYPLGPQITDAQRLEIEQKVSTALQGLKGDLAGKYYSLVSLKEDERKQLIEDHFLFKEGDRFLEACGLNRDWPKGRGIFHNVDKTFLVWINEEDQLRIISMQPGADIRAVFDRLCRACNEISKIVAFAYDEKYGFITSCPTNLGTALRASVHIKLPKLGKKMDEFQKIADQFYVQIRGIHGEHSETHDFTYDISNRRRLGRSTVDLVQDMYNGVKAMIEKEKSLP